MSAAVGRLSPEKRAAVDRFLALLPLDETGHVTDCGFDDAEKCGCYTLPERIAAGLDDHLAAFKAEAVAAIEAARSAHWQQHLRDHPYADHNSCPGDYGKHDAYYHAARIVRNLNTT